MSTPQQLKGEHLQIDHVTSTSDLYNFPIVSKFPLKCRPTYRKSHKLSYRVSRRMDVQLHRMSQHDDNTSTTFAMIMMFLIFTSSLTVLFLVYRTFPNLTDEERQNIKLPMNIEDAKHLGLVLNRYKGDHYFKVMTGISMAYIFLQTFAIPGSLFLSILIGFLFPFSIALFLICTCSAIGASLCFLLSQQFGRKIIIRYFPERAEIWSQQVEKHRSNLFNYILFLRITPFLPNWFINLSAPVIGVPLIPFALGTFFGVAPPSFVAIQGGQTLQNMTSDDFAFNVKSLVWLGILGGISLLPIALKDWFKKKLD